MSFKNCLVGKDWVCLFDWTFSNIFWMLIELTIFGVILNFLIAFIKAPFVVKKLAKNNRFAIGGMGPGTKAADVFIDICRADRIYDEIILTRIDNTEQRRVRGQIAEQHLVGKGLVEVYEDNRNKIKKIRAIKKFKNWVILQLLITKLIHKYDDVPTMYQDIRWKWWKK